MCAIERMNHLYLPLDVYLTQTLNVRDYNYLSNATDI